MSEPMNPSTENSHTEPVLYNVPTEPADPITEALDRKQQFINQILGDAALRDAEDNPLHITTYAEIKALAADPAVLQAVIDEQQQRRDRMVQAAIDRKQQRFEKIRARHFAAAENRAMIAAAAAADVVEVVTTRDTETEPSYDLDGDR